MAADDSPLIGKVEIVNAPSEPSLNVTASVTVPGTVEVTQGTVPWDVGQDPGSDPWIVGGTVAATQSGSWTVAATQSGSWSVTVSGTVAVTQSGSWTVAATQSGSWTVAITGSVTVTGTVAATQSGSWTVAATQSGSWSVTVSGTVAATQSGSWTVTADQGGSWTVAITGTVAVTQSGSWTVAATQSGTWSVTVSGTVAATQSGSWTVAATQSGSWTASVTQSTSPWVTQDKSSSATGSAVPATAMAGGLEGGDGHLHTAQGDTNGNAYVLPIAGTLNANLLLVTGGLVAFGLTQQFGALLALCSWGGLDGTESTPLFMTLYTPGSFISPITMDQKGRFTEGLFNLSCAGAGDSVILQAVNGPAMFSIEYEIFGVTIADVEQLISPPTGVSYSGDGGITIEPVVRARQGSKIAISGNVSDTTDPTITLLESDDVWYEEWVASGSADVTVATTIFDITGSGSFAFVRPAHAAWALELSSGTWNITVAVIE